MNKPKAYIVHMSVKNLDVRIDEEEIDKVLQGIRSGNPIKVKQGIINPSFFAGITVDVDRIKKYEDELSDTLRNNEQVEKLGIGFKKYPSEFKKLEDIFSDNQLADHYRKLLN